jgi:hypothetical protein
MKLHDGKIILSITLLLLRDVVSDSYYGFGGYLPGEPTLDELFVVFVPHTSRHVEGDVSTV